MGKKDRSQDKLPEREEIVSGTPHIPTGQPPSPAEEGDFVWTKVESVSRRILSENDVERVEEITQRVVENSISFSWHDPTTSVGGGGITNEWDNIYIVRIHKT